MISLCKLTVGDVRSRLHTKWLCCNVCNASMAHQTQKAHVQLKYQQHMVVRPKEVQAAWETDAQVREGMKRGA